MSFLFCSGEDQTLFKPSWKKSTKCLHRLHTRTFSLMSCGSLHLYFIMKAFGIFKVLVYLVLWDCTKHNFIIEIMLICLKIKTMQTTQEVHYRHAIYMSTDGCRDESILRLFFNIKTASGSRETHADMISRKAASTDKSHFAFGWKAKNEHWQDGLERTFGLRTLRDMTEMLAVMACTQFHTWNASIRPGRTLKKEAHVVSRTLYISHTPT